MRFLYIATRFFHFASLVLLVGLPTFVLVVARPAWQRRGAPDDRDLVGLDRLLLRITGLSVVVAFVSVIALVLAIFGGSSG